jgi:hypothetical protein
MKRYWLALTVVAAAACFDVSSPLPPILILSPILDSMFVGDSLLPRDVVYYNSDGQRANPGPLTWTIGPSSVATINATTGVVHGVGKGVATISVSGGQATGLALVAVSRTLDMTLLMDTVVLMQQDTLTIPYAVQKKNALAHDTVWFDPSSSSRMTITSTGLVTAVTSGGALPYVVHVTTGGADTVSDTGAVVILALTDTTAAGHFFQTVFGTAIRHEGGKAVAVNYTRLNGRLAFQLVDSALSTDSTLLDRLFVTLRDSIIRGDTTFEIDSIGSQEALGSQPGTLNPVCNPRRPWALWRSDHYVTPLFTIFALSHGTPSDSVAGSMSITQFAPATGGGAIISGRYQFKAQRTEPFLYGDPLGAEVIRGTFVAPLRTRLDVCPG